MIATSTITDSSHPVIEVGFHPRVISVTSSQGRIQDFQIEGGAKDYEREARSPLYDWGPGHA